MTSGDVNMTYMT